MKARSKRLSLEALVNLIRRAFTARVPAEPDASLQALEATRQELARYAKMYHLVADNAQDFIWTANSELEYTWCSPACEPTAGYRPDELIGRSILFWLPDEEGQSHQAVRNRLEGMISSGIEASSIPFDNVQYRRKDGSLGWCDCKVSVLRDDNGEITGLVGTARDTSERIEAQEQAEEAAKQLRLAQKIDSIGHLAGGFAHDYNNVLVAIQGYSDLAYRHPTTSGEVKRFISEIQRASFKAKNLTMQLLTFSRRQATSLEPLSLNALVSDLGDMLARLVPSGVTLKIALEEPLPQVGGDHSQIGQLIVNLCMNAKEAMEDGGGTLTVESAVVEVDEQQAAEHPRANPGRYVRLSVTDTGIGIEPNTLDHVFEPFFTTKQEGEGTGLGLSVVHGIVVEHGGFLTLASDQRSGTSVKVYFPALEEAAECSATDTGTTQAGGHETILVVEDDEQVRSFTTLILSQAGYTVLTAEDGALGWELFLKQRGKISAIVCDVVMPRMGGRQLLRRVREEDDTVPFLFVSGYVGKTNPQRFAERYQVEFLQKPFSAANLQQKVRKILDRPTRTTPGRQRVLAVDDNESVLHLLELDIQELGHSVVLAANGAEAIEACKSDDFDIIFMDLKMSPVDGIEATREILRHRLHHGQIIGLTANFTEDDERHCIEAGMTEIITKPIRYDKLAGLLGGGREQDDQRHRVAETTVFDLDVSLHLTNNRVEVAGEMFDILLQQLPEDQRDINDAWDSNDMEALALRVHRLNGAARYCGVPALGCAIDELETRIKSPDEGDIQEAIDAVNARIVELLNWSRENPNPFHNTEESSELQSSGSSV